tara:strand:+ start:100 stop:1173 length:1074 start_codon:yes stop_codon:yes gene_type:complete
MAPKTKAAVRKATAVEDPAITAGQAKDFCRAYSTNCTALAIKLIPLPLPLNSDKKDPHCPIPFSRLVLGPVETNAGTSQPASKTQGWGPNHLCAIFDALISSGYSRLLSLNIWSISIGGVGAAAVASFLCRNRSITSIEISDCGINAHGCDAFGKALARNATLTQLNLDNNLNIGDAGAAALLAGLETPNRCLSRLSLAFCEVCTAGSIAIGARIHMLHNLTTLELKGNPLSAAGVSALLSSGVRSHGALESLGLSDTGWGRETVAHAALGQVLKTNPRARKFDLRGNLPMGDGCAYAYAKLLETTSKHVIEFKIEPQEIDPQLIRKLNDACAANLKTAEKKKKQKGMARRKSTLKK